MSDLVTTREGRADALGNLLRYKLKLAMAARGLSEERFARELSDLSDRPISTGLAHAWTAESKHKWRMPSDVVPFVCEILRDDSIQRILLSAKLRQSLELGESTPRVVALLRSALAEATERKQVEGGKKPKRSKR